MGSDYRMYVKPVIALAKQAGAAILEIYERHGELPFQLKADKTPLTEADLVANELIKLGLQELTPEIKILSEEEAEIPFTERSKWQRYWLVDPLDGTKEFIERSGQFTVNIALIANNKPVLGVIYAPVFASCYYAWRHGGAFREDASGEAMMLHTRKITNGKVRVIISRTLGENNLEPLLGKLKEYELEYFGGSLKLCKVAEGAFDFYPRMSINCEWDTAAGQCIVEEAGGVVLDLENQPIRYNTKASFDNPNFLVVGDPGYWNKCVEGS